MGTNSRQTDPIMKMFIVLVVAIAAVSASKDQLVNLAAGDPQVMLGLFNQFQWEFGKEYEPAERRIRLANFQRFVKQAASYNEVDDDVTYGITLFADMTEAEAARMYGFNSTDVPQSVGEKEDDDEDDPANPKFNLGTNHQARFGPAKNQNPTSGCWAFAATAVLEGHTSIVNGRYTALSEQELADCTPGSTLANGGLHWDGLEAIRGRQHLSTSADVPFTYRDGNHCNTQHRNALPFRITSVSQARGDNGLASALASGPVAVGMRFDGKLEAYQRGIYSDRSCMSTNPNHAVTAVGYTGSYWIIRNSWGTSQWGESCYGRFTRQHNNMCGISEFAFSVTVQRNGQEKEE